MSSYHQIFVQTGETEQQFLDDLRSLVDADLKEVDHPGSVVKFGGYYDDSIFEVEIGHELDDDFGMDFSNYQIIVTIRELHSNNSLEERTARNFCTKLHSRGGYKLLLVYDLQDLIASY